MRKIGLALDWQGDLHIEEVALLAKAADESGVHSLRVAEAWGRDAFTTLAVLAHETKHIQLGTGVVNYYSRTPAALAQHFGALDQLSGGRMFIGLGSSSPQVVEQFHGVSYGKPIARLGEYVKIIDALLAKRPLSPTGEYFKLERGFTLRFTPVRPHIPIYVGAMTPRSLRSVASVADGLLAMTMPIERTAEYVRSLLDQVTAAGRDAGRFELFSNFGTVIVTEDAKRGYERIAATTAFYIARMGDFYFEHFGRIGMGDEATAARSAWQTGGVDAAAAVLAGATRRLGVAGSVAECIDWLEREREAGMTVLTVDVEESDFHKRVAIFKQLVG